MVSGHKITIMVYRPGASILKSWRRFLSDLTWSTEGNGRNKRVPFSSTRQSLKRPSFYCNERQECAVYSAFYVIPLLS